MGRKSSKSKNVAAKNFASSKIEEQEFSNEYEGDDMPKKFKRLMNPVKKTKISTVPVAGAKKEVSEWDIRPGESFRQFNERLSLASSSKDNPNTKDVEVGSGKNFKSKIKIASEFAEARGLRSKRKEHLKQRDKKMKKKTGEGVDSDFEGEVLMDSFRFGETVMAPPEIKVKPRNAPKSSLPFKRK